MAPAPLRTGRPSWPAAIVLGIESPIGVTLVRELGRHGVHVIGIARSKRSAGLCSRYLRQGVIRAADEGAFVEQLQALATENPGAVLLAISETDLALLNAQRERLTSLRLLIPAEDRLSVVLDKARTRELAMKVDIEVPHVWNATSLAALAEQKHGIRFPIVTKWADPHAVSGWLHERGLPVDKFRYCLDWADLERYLQRFDGLGTLPMIQEYCAGYGLGQSIFMHCGQALAIFQHRRIHEWPPEGGSSSLCVSLGADEHVELQGKSVALLREIGWEGPAMVEYRLDPTTGRACLMEINGRFWGSLPLASQAGVEFGWLTYSVLGLGEVPAPVVPRADVQCAFVVPEGKRWWRILRHPELIQDPSIRFDRWIETWSFFRTQLSPGTRRFLFAWSDPMPAVADFVQGLSKRL